MKLILTETRWIETPAEDLSIRYELLSGDGSGTAQYSVRLLNENTGEIAEVRDLTADEGRALRFFDSVLRGSVTPVTLREIAEDFAAAF